MCGVGRGAHIADCATPIPPTAALCTHRPKRIAPGCLDWLTVEPPDARLGYSIYLYQVNRPRIERLLAARGRVEPFWRSGPPS